MEVTGKSQSQYVIQFDLPPSQVLTYMPPPPCSNGPAYVFMCHRLRFAAMYSVILYSFMYSQMLPCHLSESIFCFLTPACLPSSWRGVVIGSMLASLQVSSLMMRPFFVPAFSSQWCRVFVYHSDPYIIAGLTMVL